VKENKIRVTPEGVKAKPLYLTWEQIKFLKKNYPKEKKQNE